MLIHFQANNTFKRISYTIIALIKSTKYNQVNYYLVEYKTRSKLIPRYESIKLTCWCWQVLIIALTSTKG